MKTIFRTINLIIQKPKNILYILFISILFIYIYYWAITQVVSFERFLQHNDILYVILQISLSIFNSIITAIAIVVLLNLQKSEYDKKDNIIQTIIAFIGSIFTTGCYVCGSLFLPSLGIGSIILSLPFGGLEVKFATAIILIYSLYNLSEKYLGICKVYKDKYIKFVMSDNTELKLNIKPLIKNVQLISIYIIAMAIIILPVIIFNDTEIFSKDKAVENSCVLNK